MVYVVCARVHTHAFDCVDVGVVLHVYAPAWVRVLCARFLSEQLQQAMLRSLGVKRTPEQLEQKYGARWLSKSRANREIRRREKVDSHQIARSQKQALCIPLMVCKYVLARSAAVFSYHAHTNDSNLR